MGKLIWLEVLSLPVELRYETELFLVSGLTAGPNSSKGCYYNSQFLPPMVSMDDWICDGNLRAGRVKHDIVAHLSNLREGALAILRYIIQACKQQALRPHQYPEDGPPKTFMSEHCPHISSYCK